MLYKSCEHMSQLAQEVLVDGHYPSMVITCISMVKNVREDVALREGLIEVDKCCSNECNNRMVML